MGKYLYGASVQGIQDFIFKTNKLQEIIGASEIVKNVADEFLNFSKNNQIIMNAAGNIKTVFDNKEDLEKVVLRFPKLIQQKAYGLTISQAVIKINGDVQTQEEINNLEKKLKIQRNKPTIPLDISFNIMDLNPKTARVITKYKDNEALDISSLQKRDAYSKWFNEKRKENPNFKELVDLESLSNSKNKIAVIHIDGNGLGQLLPKLKIPISEFSKKLDFSTKEAFKLAKTEDMQIREVILGGDDVTVICNADNALEFTKNFLLEFEKITKSQLGNKLTACAGISFVNKKFPFHYAISLAEELCKEAKKHSKNINENLAPSSLMFHNIQSSSFQDMDTFIENELTIKNDKETIRCDFGPYYLNEDTQPKIEDFINVLKAYKVDGSPIKRLRNWVSELYKSDTYAKELLKRINTITAKSNFKNKIMDNALEKLHKDLSNDNLIIDKDSCKKTPIYDILQILSITEVK